LSGGLAEASRGGAAEEGCLGNGMEDFGGWVIVLFRLKVHYVNISQSVRFCYLYRLVTPVTSVTYPYNVNFLSNGKNTPCHIEIKKHYPYPWSMPPAITQTMTL
jgi:hypothetical protein